MENTHKFLTDYERDLLEHVELLERHIRERDGYLIKVNGYCPGWPGSLNESDYARDEFMAKFKPWDELLDSVTIISEHYRNTERIKGMKRFISFESKNPMIRAHTGRYGIFIEQAKLIKAFSGEWIDCKIANAKTIIIPEEGRLYDIIRGNGYGDNAYGFPIDMFSEIKPRNNPEFSW